MKNSERAARLAGLYLSGASLALMGVVWSGWQIGTADASLLMSLWGLLAGVLAIVAVRWTAKGGALLALATVQEAAEGLAEEVAEKRAQER